LSFNIPFILADLLVLNKYNFVYRIALSIGL